MGWGMSFVQREIERNIYRLNNMLPEDIKLLLKIGNKKETHWIDNKIPTDKTSSPDLKSIWPVTTTSRPTDESDIFFPQADRSHCHHHCKSKKNVSATNLFIYVVMNERLQPHWNIWYYIVPGDTRKSHGTGDFLLLW